ncbi:3-dehydroquinate synthase family protein [Halobacteriovorax sp. JY17]|uniref:3-dehydroquinate synthase n=1 Tax=Halobacteriovorax sp. JY17 TaxID=2014617 RepID=UPI0025BB8AF7|nr:3-dehydroquinate synthase family protein [Halobacteriovorax sp. JY17]
MNSKIEFCKLDYLKEKIRSIDSDLILIIADLNVWSLYSKTLPLLKIEGKKIVFWKAPDGEKVKNFENLESVLDYFLSKNVHRKAHLISLGGGATSDFSGMVAALLLRGIKWSTIPTTLLSMVDAAIGGKVAINSSLGKNLIGAFHHPEHIWVCDSFLETLDQIEVSSGAGEILKYGLLSKEIFDKITPDVEIKTLIKDCILFKEKIVTEDFKESGVRKILNLGHTFGHAIESEYQLPHGISVIWGVVLVDLLFKEGKHFKDIKVLTENLNIELGDAPWLNKEFPLTNIMKYLRRDKKSTSNEFIDFVLVEEIGKTEITSISFTEVESKIIEKKDAIKKLSI